MKHWYWFNLLLIYWLLIYFHIAEIMSISLLELFFLAPVEIMWKLQQYCAEMGHIEMLAKGVALAHMSWNLLHRVNGDWLILICLLDLF